MDVTYAKVGGPPDDWQQLQVRDLDSDGNNLVDGVVEVNTEEGWCEVVDRQAPRAEGEPLPTRRVTGRFVIERQGG